MPQLSVPPVYALLHRAAASVPTRTAIALPGRRTTYAELHDRVDQLARALLARGLRRGSRIAILGPNSGVYLELLLAIWSLGAVAVPINARFRSVELRHVLPDAQLDLLLLSGAASQGRSWVERMLDAFPELAGGEAAGGAGEAGLPPVVLFETAGAPPTAWGTLDDLVAAGHPVTARSLRAARDGVRLRDPAVIFYTSGTTAAPKGCQLSHEAIVRQSMATADRLDHRDADVLFSPLPMFHTGCSQLLLDMLWRRGTYVTLPVPDPDAGRSLCLQEGVTVMFTAFPPITDGLVQHPGASELFAGVRSLFSVGAPDQLRALQSVLPETAVVNGYGMTEFAGSIVQTSPLEPLARRLDQGTPLPGVEVRILDPWGAPLPPGEPGMIAASSPTMFDRYLGAAEVTSGRLTPDGLFRTGDIGSIDEEGRLTFLGRDKDMLKVGGENVAALEIEAHLTSHPGIRAAAVVGVPDERLGEVPVAFVEPVDGGQLTVDAVLEHCRGAIASFKVPREVRFVQEWPMSATKIRKTDLLALLDVTDRR